MISTVTLHYDYKLLWKRVLQNVILKIMYNLVSDLISFGFQF